MLPLLKILLVFTLIIFMLRKKIGLGTTMMVSSLLLGALFGMTLIPLVKQMVLTLVTPDTLELITALVLIMILESIMRQTGMLRSMTESLFQLPWNFRILTVSIPAIIGFLPSAGGARFSAPLVGQATSEMPYQAEHKVLINYWFRHIWEYSLPMYPGVLLASHFSGLAISTLLLWLFPISILWALLGYWYIIRNYEKKDELRPTSEDVNSDHHTGSSLIALLLNTWPLWATVVLVFANISIALALCGILLVLMIQKRYPLLQVAKTLVEPLTLRIIILTWGTMAFKDVLEASGAVQQISSAIVDFGVPTLLLVTILPLMAGMLTGIVQACIGVAFPLVLAVAHPSPAIVMLAYVSGVLGVMLSPVHLCLILTVEYFKADFVRSYKLLFAPCLLLMVMTMAIFQVFH